jgi:hypothetical protein
LLAVFLLLVLVGFYILRTFILPRSYVKPIEQGSVNTNDYCTIDIRDYNASYRMPIEEAKNIPLSILHRSVAKENCDKNIVVVSDDTKGALIAARIIKKATKKPIFYYTV